MARERKKKNREGGRCGEESLGMWSVRGKKEKSQKLFSVEYRPSPKNSCEEGVTRRSQK